MTIKTTILSGAALAGLVLSAPAALAADLIYGSWLPEAEYTNRVALPKVFEEIAAGSDVNWKLVPGGQLVNPIDTWDAVESGLVQGGMGIPQYVPSVVPNINTIYQTVLPGTETLAATGAALDTMLLGCPSCQQELKDLNMVALAGWDTSPYYLGCTSEVAGLDDLKGMKVRAAGGSVRLMEALGATPVAATLVEAINLLQTGGLDCVFGVANWYRSFGYGDFVKYHVNYPLGMTGPATGWLINRDAWTDMSDEAKALHVRAAAEVAALTARDQFVIEAGEVLDWAVAEKGVTVVEVDAAAFGAKMDAFIAEQDAATVEASTAAGVADPQAIIDTYRANFEKWKGLTAGITTTEELTDLLMNEIYSKIDLSSL